MKKMLDHFFCAVSAGNFLKEKNIVNVSSLSIECTILHILTSDTQIIL